MHWTTWVSTLDFNPSSWPLKPLLSLYNFLIWVFEESTMLAYLALSDYSFAFFPLASLNWASRSAMFLSTIVNYWLTKVICLGASAALFLRVTIWSEFFWMLSTTPEYWFLIVVAWVLQVVNLYSKPESYLELGAFFCSIFVLYWTKEFFLSTRAPKAVFKFFNLPWLWESWLLISFIAV